MNTDMSRVRFSDRPRWGKDDKFKVIDEEKLQNPNKYFMFSWDEIRTNKKIVAIYLNISMIMERQPWEEGRNA